MRPHISTQAAFAAPLLRAGTVRLAALMAPEAVVALARGQSCRTAVAALAVYAPGAAGVGGLLLCCLYSVGAMQHCEGSLSRDTFLF